jgi:hemoglobin/transferrin/lactoferrin receptor protein
VRDGGNFAAIDLGYSGSSEQTKLGLTGATTMGEWASSAVVTLRNGSEVQNFAGTLPGYDSNSTAFLAKTERELNNNRAIKFTLDYFDQETDQVITAGQVETVDSDSNVSVSVDYLSENVTAWFDSFEGQLYYTDYEQQSEQVRYTASSRGAYTDYNDYKFEQDIFGARAIYTKEIVGESVTQNLVYGLDVDLYDTQRPRYKTRINSDGSIAIDNEEQKAFPGAQTTLAGLYLQNDIKLKDSNFSFVLGARLDYYDMQANQNPAYDISQLVDYTETALSPKVAVRYAFSDAITGYAQYVAGFKIPPHDQAYQSHGVMSPGFSYEIIPNAELDAEESDTYELGLRFIDDRVSASANVFYADFSNFIENVFVGVRPNPIPGWPGILQYQYQNQDAAEIKGAEAQLTYALTDSLDLTANIGYTDGENTETGYKLTTISPVSGSVLLTYTANTWGITGAVRAVDAMTDVAPVESRMGGMSTGATSSGYAVADLYANYEIGNLILRAGIENLFDKEYIPYQSIAGQPEGSSNFGDYTQPGRNFSLSASYIF